MRRLPVLASLAFALGTPASARADLCAAPGERVAARSAQTVVTEERRITGEGPLGQPDTESVWRACHRATGERIELERGFGRWKQFRGVSHVRLAGPYVAWLLDESDYVGSSASVMRRDLRGGGSTVLAWSSVGLDALRLHASGAAAWKRTIGHRSAARLEARSDTGATRLLDRVRDARRLRAVHFDSAGTLHWRHGRRARTARLVRSES